MKRFLRIGLVSLGLIAGVAGVALGQAATGGSYLTINNQSSLIEGNALCDGGTFQDIYYLGSQDHTLIDTFAKGVGDYVYRFNFSPSYVGFYNPSGVVSLENGANAFPWRSQGSPHNVDRVVVASATMNVANSLPAGYTRGQVAAQLVYHITRTRYPHAAGLDNDLVYLDYANMAAGTQSYSYNVPFGNYDPISDNECFNIHIAYCGDGIVDNSSLSHSTNINDPLNGGEQCDDGNNVDGDGCSATCQTETPAQDFDLALRKTLSSNTPEPLQPGDNVRFNIYVRNQGDVAATNITIVDYIPAGLTLNDSNWTQNGNQATRTIDALATGSDNTIFINFTIDANFTGTSITNIAEIASATSANGAADCDSTPDTNANNDGTPVDNDIGTGCDDTTDEDDHDPEMITIEQPIPVLDLALRKTVSNSTPGPFTPGDTVTFDITVINQGNVDVTEEVSVVDYVPNGLTYVSSSVSVDVNGDEILMEFAPLAANDTVVETITFTIDDDFTGTTITNNAEIEDVQFADGSIYTDCDSTFDHTLGNDGTPANNVVGSGCGDTDDEDDHDPETITIGQPTGSLTVQKTGVLVGNGGVRYTISYGHTNGPVTNPVITDTVPDGLCFNYIPNTLEGQLQYSVNNRATRSNLAPSNPCLITDFRVLGYGSYANQQNASRSFNVYFTIDNEQSEYCNIVVYSADGISYAEDEACVQASWNFDLALRKMVNAATPGPFDAGDTVTFDITVVNQGGVAATNIQVVDYIPAGLTLTDPDWSQSGNTATRNYGTIAAGGNKTLSITFTIDSDFTGTTIRNAAEISSASGGNDCDSTADSTDANTSGEKPANLQDNELGGECDTPNQGDEDDHDIEMIPVNTGVVDLTIEKQIDATRVVDNQTVQFTINFKNQGNATATNVEVVDTLPRGYTYVGATLTSYTGGPSAPSVSTASGPNGSTLIKLNGLTLDPNEGGTIKVTAKANTDYCDAMTNVVSISTNGVETNVNNNTDTAVATCESKLTLDKQQKGGDSNSFTDSTITVEPGDTIRYRIVVGHAGALSTDLSLIDDLPSEVTYKGNLDFTVAGSSSDSLCDYDSGDHEITCKPFELDNTQKAVLEFDVEVKSDVDDNDTIVNLVTLYEDGRNVDDDQVKAITNDEEPEGKITKKADDDVLEVGERVDFDIEFTNIGTVDIVRYTITDIWPADELALVCDDDLYGTEEDHSDNASRLENCLEDNLRIEHSRHGRLSNNDIRFDVDIRSNRIEVELDFDIDRDAEHRLRPRESVSFSLRGEAFVEMKNITNVVEVAYSDDDGDEVDGRDDDNDDVDVEGGYGQCVEIEAGTLEYDPDYETYSIGYSCVADDTAQKIELDCGNGDRFVVRNKDSLTQVCQYNREGTYEVTCRFNGERTASPACTDYRTIKIPEGPSTPYCGDGVKDYYEQCDYNDSSKAGWGTKGCSERCVAIDAPFCTRYPGHPDCVGTPKPPVDKPFCELYPTHWRCVTAPSPTVPSCLFVDSAESIDGQVYPLSVMTDELLPYRWAIDVDTNKTVQSCGDNDAGKIERNGALCTFALYKNQLDAAVWSKSVNCFGKEGGELLASLDRSGAMPSFAEAQNILNLADIGVTELGEYKLVLEKFDYRVCGEEQNTVSEECCQVNFTITKPYVIQQGLSATKEHNKSIYGTLATNPLDYYTRIDGTTFSENGSYDKINYEPVSESDFDGGAAVANAVNNFADKYTALALGNSRSRKKVPGKQIYVYEGNGSIKVSDLDVDGAYTVIVNNPDATVTVDKDIDTNAMYVMRDGTLYVSKAVDEMNGIFVLHPDAAIDADIVRNSNRGDAWTTVGGLVINGVLVADDTADLAKARRSVLRGWFYGNVDKQEMFEKGASLLIKNNPQLWLAPPPGVDELDAVFEVYKN